MEENQRGDYKVTPKDLDERTKDVGVLLKQQVAKEMAKVQAKEMEIGGK